MQLDVFDDAGDGHLRAVRHASAHALAERVFIRPRREGERFADEREGLCPLPILRVEDAYRDELNYHRAKVVMSYDAVRDDRRDVVLLGAPFDLKGFAAALKAHRQAADRADRFDPG